MQVGRLCVVLLSRRGAQVSELQRFSGQVQCVRVIEKFKDVANSAIS